MASEEQNYTADFKLNVAQKALDQSKQNLEKLSKKYNVPVSVILMWATELEKGGPESFREPDEDEAYSTDTENVEVEIDNPKIAQSVSHGVMDDQLNYKRLIFWSVAGVILVILFVQGVKEIYFKSGKAIKDRVAAQSEFYQVKQLERDATKQLDSFGVVNLDKGVYHIPIDSAIAEMAQKQDQ